MHSMLFVDDVPSGAKYSQVPQNWQAFTDYAGAQVLND
jgi:hypothetical protein